MDRSCLTQEDLECLLLLSRTPGIRMRNLRTFGEEGRSPREILDQIERGANEDWKESLQATKRAFNPEKELEKAERLGIRILGWGEPEYPKPLKETADPPFALYVRGELLELDQAALAIVGSRHPSFYGIEQAKRFAEKLAQWGLTIISGFARGIDRASHEGALAISQGRTLAILGSGLDVIYPKEHQPLYEEIRERGVLLSEFAFGTPPLPENFPKRNRIIAGLALGVLVIEAHSRSGSLITARLAAEEGREVFALPGRVDQLGSRGTHRLIKEGAALVESPEEILDALAGQLWPLISNPLQRAPSSPPLFDEKEEGFLAFLEKSPLTFDQAVKESRLPAGEAAALLTRLELKGAIRRRLDFRYERKKV